MHKDTGVSQGTDDKVASPSCQTALVNQSVIPKSLKFKSLQSGGSSWYLPKEMEDDVRSVTSKPCHVLFIYFCDLMCCWWVKLLKGRKKIHCPLNRLVSRLCTNYFFFPCMHCVSMSSGWLPTVFISGQSFSIAATSWRDCLHAQHPPLNPSVKLKISDIVFSGSRHKWVGYILKPHVESLSRNTAIIHHCDALTPF